MVQGYSAASPSARIQGTTVYVVNDPLFGPRGWPGAGLRREQSIGRPRLLDSAREAARALLLTGCRNGALLLMPFAVRHHVPISLSKRTATHSRTTRCATCGSRPTSCRKGSDRRANRSVPTVQKAPMNCLRRELHGTHEFLGARVGTQKDWLGSNRGLVVPGKGLPISVDSPNHLLSQDSER